jgi:hypothetical protein|tara:strand:- start:1897 stop:3036 length:1140 start_codon:yes stop_codon:yes gene_type:complete
MASIYKKLGVNDTTKTTTNLHESIPITGTILSGTYGTFPSGNNAKYFSANDHVDVYDYPYASSSANMMFSLTAGVSEDAPLNDHIKSQKAKKNAIYRQFAQQYVGYDKDHNVIEFNISGTTQPESGYSLLGSPGNGGAGVETTTGPRIEAAIFMDFSRVLMKDEIKKGSFKVTIGTGSYDEPFHEPFNTFSDYHVTDTTGFKDNSPMGEYALLQNGTDTAATVNTSTFGLVYYQAGMAVFFNNKASMGEQLVSGSDTKVGADYFSLSGSGAFMSASIPDICNGFRHRIYNVEFNNTTELNSTIYFCRVNHNEFNYSANPSFTSASQVFVKNNATDPSVTYATSVGLYSADNELLATAKLSEPLKKRSDTEFTLRVRLDY